MAEDGRSGNYDNLLLSESSVALWWKLFVAVDAPDLHKKHLARRPRARTLCDSLCPVELPREADDGTKQE
jgi:hypothetical protein